MNVRSIIRVLRSRISESLAGVLAPPAPSIHPFIKLTQRLEEALLDRIQADGALYFPDPAELRRHALGQMIPEGGLVLEFGVFDGTSIRQIANLSGGTVHGFDTFEGLPRGDGLRIWEKHVEEASFDLKGQLPDVPDNVVLHKGLFEDTLPRFLRETPGSVAFLHVDCDLYSSAKAVLDLLAARLIPGSIAVFDDFFNYSGWQFGEYRALTEFVRENGVHYTILGVATRDPNDQKFGHFGRICLRIDGLRQPSDPRSAMRPASVDVESPR